MGLLELYHFQDAKQQNHYSNETRVTHLMLYGGLYLQKVKEHKYKSIRFSACLYLTYTALYFAMLYR